MKLALDGGQSTAHCLLQCGEALPYPLRACIEKEQRKEYWFAFGLPELGPRSSPALRLEFTPSAPLLIRRSFNHQCFQVYSLQTANYETSQLP